MKLALAIITAIAPAALSLYLVCACVAEFHDEARAIWLVNAALAALLLALQALDIWREKLAPLKRSGDVD